jgi:hypothetical protein
MLDCLFCSCIFGKRLGGSRDAIARRVAVGCDALVPDPGSAPDVAPTTRELVVRSETAIDTTSPAGGSFLRRLRGLLPWRAPENGRQDPALSLDELSLRALRTELQAIDQEMARATAKLNALQEAEKHALERRDKLALDVAWEAREGELHKLQSLEHKRAAIHDMLVKRLAPELQGWRNQAVAEVAAWREQDRTWLEELVEHLQAIESIGLDLSLRMQRRAERREEMLEELEALIRRADPVPVARPDVDWSVPEIDLSQAVELLDRDRQLISGLPAQTHTDVPVTIAP